MAKFEFVSKYKDCGLPLPRRGTAFSAGYDLSVVEDTLVPSHLKGFSNLINLRSSDPLELPQMKEMVNLTKFKPTLVSTGVKCYLANDEYLKVVLRSSTPLKYWLMMANSTAIIDSDYVSNVTNEGEIFLQLINLSPFDIQLKKGDVIAQGIISRYYLTEDDIANGTRSGGLGSTSV